MKKIYQIDYEAPMPPPQLVAISQTSQKSDALPDTNLHTIIDPVTFKLVELVESTAANMGKFAEVILIRLQAPKNITNLAQLSQTSRLFISKFLKYSLNSEVEFQKIKQVHLITSDVDLAPLSNRIYHTNKKFNLVNPLTINKYFTKLYVALSCVGANLEDWDSLIPDSGEELVWLNATTNLDETYTYNGEGIINYIQKYIAFHHPKARGVQWFIDQILISDRFKKLANEIDAKYNDPMDKKKYMELLNLAFNARDARTEANNNVDRGHVGLGLYFQSLESMLDSASGRQAHLMRDGYNLKTWWQLYFLFKRICSKTQLSKLANYRYQVAKLILKGQGKIGSQNEYNRIKADEEFRQTIMKEVKNLSDNEQDLDIALEWSQFYPRVYKNVKPMMINWNTERVFKQEFWIPPKEKLKSKSNKKDSNENSEEEQDEEYYDTYALYYKVVPNNIVLFNKTINELLCLRDEDKINKPKCKEIKFEKRK